MESRRRLSSHLAWLAVVVVVVVAAAAVAAAVLQQLSLVVLEAAHPLDVEVGPVGMTPAKHKRAKLAHDQTTHRPWHASTPSRMICFPISRTVTPHASTTPSS